MKWSWGSTSNRSCRAPNHNFITATQLPPLEFQTFRKKSLKSFNKRELEKH